MKQCAKCGDHKAEDEFYERDRTCKECRKRMVRENRSANLEYYREFDRQRANNPNRVAARIAYLETERGKKAANAAKARYRQNHPDKSPAHDALNNEIRDKKLIRSPCCTAPGCFSTKNIQGHHPDYDQPLSVVWLCAACHSQLHKEHREWLRAS
ncbi:hypothetical protein [Pseudomonas nitroreducens]|uniref:hypothetical protein n=1 Tax=Pseudomonas nitroreducens TaxID=46680 RepID=UPI002FDF5D6C